MKKILLSSLIAAAAAVPAFAGVNNLNYQAVIKNGTAVVANENVELKFELVDGEDVVYNEVQYVKTNASGFVACQLGNNSESFSTINWGNLNLRVSIDLGNGYEVISNEAVSSVPTALYALRTADTDEIKDAVEELMIDVESNKISLLGVNAELAKIDGFIEDVENFNTELSKQLEPMMGLNYEEVNDFHQRVSEALTNLMDSNEELNTNTEAFATMAEGRFDNVEKQLGDLTNDLENLGENVNNIGSIARANEQAIDELNTNTESMAIMIEGRFDKVEKELGDAQKDIEELNENTDAFADMVEARFDKVEKGVADTDADIENIKENLTKSFEVKDAEIAEINGQLENLNNVAAVTRANEEAIDELTSEVEGLVKDNEETQTTLRNLSADITKLDGVADDFAEFKEEFGETFQGLSDFQQGVTVTLQELQTKIAALEAKIAELEGK